MTNAVVGRDGFVARIPLAAVAALLLASVVIIVGFGDTTFALWYNDLGEAAAAGFAAICTYRRSRAVDSARGQSWLVLSIGCAAWAAGELIWCWYELIDGRARFPSFADIGFLTFGVAASAAVLLYPTDQTRESRAKRTFDAVSTTSAFALIVWIGVLGPITGNHTEDSFGYVISLAYPLTDVSVLILTMLTLGRVASGRRSLLFVAMGFIALSVSDSLFATLQAAAHYTGGASDLGWFVGFGLIALGALATDQPTAEVARASTETAEPTVPSFIPYVPFLAAFVVTVAMAIAGQGPNGAQLTFGAVLVLLLLARQYVTLRANLMLTSDLAAREAELHHRAFHDNLTGLANRALFQNRLAHAIDLHARDMRPVAVIFLDLDDFKIVNDTLGHRVGDELLGHVAERITAATRSGDTVARLGGDEFAVLVEGFSDPSRTAARITEALRPPFSVADQRITVTASLGIVSLDSDASATADTLVTRADTAMYAAKRGGKGRIEVFREGMSLLELSDKQLSAALARALATNEVQVAFQPIVELATGAVHSIETLARWTHEGQSIPPDVFIPVAERTGVINDLTEYVIQRACEQAVACTQIPGYEKMPVAVNIPPQQIGTPSLERTIRAMIDRYQLHPNQLCIEITETGLFANIDAAKSTIDSLRALGVRVSLDDFGVGYSSLSQLHSVELDCVKIDRSFIERLETDVRQVKFLRTIIRLGQDVDLQVVAEGVERPDQLQVLRRLGCTLAQGYLFARPMTGAQILAFLVSAPDKVSAPQAALTHF